MIGDEASPLAGRWKAAMQEGKESAWNHLPDSALEDISRAGAVTPSDITFLLNAVQGAPVEAVAAVRLLALIGEEKYIEVEWISALLLDMLGHKLPIVRIAVAAAIWQLSDKTAVVSLQKALSNESHPEVRKTFEHVIRVLGT